jgi:S1-C subfamily serine protease
MAAAATTVVAVVTFICAVAAGRAAEISSGSGVVINAKGEILTNAHVVEGCQTITVKLASGNSETAALVVRAISSVAVFRDGGPVRAGDTIVALGYPLSGILATTANVSVGNVSALAGLADDSRYLQISAPVQPGNSGGPLLDASGHLVGVVTAKLDALRMARFTGDIPQNVNFALKSEVARTFLDSKGIAYQTARSDQQLTPADVGEVAGPFTVHIKCEQHGSRTLAAPIKPKESPPKQGLAVPKPTTADVQKLVQSIGGDEAKLKTYCDIGKLQAQMNQAEQNKDSKTVEALGTKADNLAKQLGPDYNKVMAGLDQIDPGSAEGKRYTALFRPLFTQCK